ncbi:MAG: cyclic nucleotide-binding domain-containing protein [Myxococcales bacterium]|nr:cyclic nucleotide-binding domain-containing protein [Myxococcales bacterium]
MLTPSLIPPEGRALTVDEHAALSKEMSRIVETSHLFKSLDDAGRTRVLSSGYVCAFSGGDTIIRQGEVGDTMYMVLSGEVTVTAHSEDAEVPLANLGRGACIGEVSIIRGGERTATVVASNDVELVAFKKKLIERVLDDYPKVRATLERVVDGRARRTIEKIVGS